MRKSEQGFGSNGQDSGTWLYALLITSVGLRMDDSSVRIAVGLPHLCSAHFPLLWVRGHKIWNSWHHSQSFDNGWNPLPDWNHLWADAKRPDGTTLIPWTSGLPLVWDATCTDTYAVSYRSEATDRAGRVAALAEKTMKYSCLAPTYQFHTRKQKINIWNLI